MRIYILAASSWLLSAFLTAQLCLRASDVMPAWILVCMGLVFEFAKGVLLLDGLRVWSRGRRGLAIVSFVAVAALVMLSIAATAAYAISVTAPTAAPRSAEQEQLGKQVEQLEHIAEQLASAGQLTRALSVHAQIRSVQAARTSMLSRGAPEPEHLLRLAALLKTDVPMLKTAAAVVVAVLLDLVGFVALAHVKVAKRANPVPTTIIPIPTDPKEARVARARALIADDRCRPTYRDLARALGCSQRAVQPIIATLKAEGTWCTNRSKSVPQQGAG